MNASTRALNPGLEFPGLRTTSAILEEHERATRTNWKNDGRPFEQEISMTAGAYQNRRIATLRKVSPPARIVGGGDDRKVIFMANPFLDWVGTWNARNGRAMFVECKSTQAHRLPFKRSGGLTEDQLSSIKTWRSAGAAVCVLWRWSQGVTLWTPEMLVAAEGRGDKSLVFESGLKVPRGEGSIVWDFLPILAQAIWPDERKSLPPASMYEKLLSNPGEVSGEPTNPTK